MDEITLNGRTYTVRTEYDSDSTPLDDDVHGDVSEWTTRAKRPGEVIIAEDRHSRRYYDMQGAIKTARADGWNCPPYDVPGETAGQRAVRAAQADFDFLRRWFDGYWQYVGVIVEDEDGETASLWGVEDIDGEYAAAVARDLAEELEATTRRQTERSTFPVSTMGA